MKRFYTMILIVLAAHFAQAQNPLFVSFYVSKDSVLKFLHTKTDVKYKDSSNDLVQAIRSGNFLEYHFAGDQLYKIKLFKNYEKKKDAELAVESVLNFYKITNSTIFNKQNDKDLQLNIAIREGVVNEVYLITLPSGSYQLKIVSKDANLEPSAMEEDLKPMSEFTFTSN